MNTLSAKAGGLFLAAVIAAFSIAAPTGAVAQDKAKPPTPAATDAPKEKQARPYPFNGKVHAVDKKAMTITLLGKEKSRVLHVDAKSKFQKMGKPATLDDVVVGEEVGGQILKSADGKEMIVSIRVGPRPETDKAPKKDKPAADK